jgi:ATP-binding cassette subfamily B protein
MSSSTKEKEAFPSLGDGFRIVWRHTKPFKSQVILLIVLGVVSALANGSVPYISGKFFDSLIQVSQGAHEAYAGFALWAVLLGLWAVIQFAANGVDWIMDRTRRDVDAKVHFSIQTNGFLHLFRLPVAFHKGAHINGVLQKMSQASWRIAAIVRTIIQIAPQFLSVVIGIALATSINMLLAGILALGVVIYSALVLRMVLPMAKVDDEAHRVWNDEWDDAAAAVHQIESVKQAASEEYQSKQVREGLLVKAYKLWDRLDKHWSNVSFFQRMIVFLTQITVFIISVGFVSNGSLTVGELMALNGYAAMLFGPFVQLGHSWQVIQNGLTSAQHAEEIFNEKQEVYEPVDAVYPKQIRGDVDFDNVSFQYGPGQPQILTGVDFKANAGDVIALVGESGVGKSTTVALISGYAFPSKGEVLIDGVPTSKHTLSNLRKHIGAVPQEVALFNDTIRENIRYGTFEASDADVERVAGEAHLGEYIESLPQKYETIVGERGVKLSVGQKQRVAIARAMLRSPSILILDEPTSALDAKTEQIVTASLERLMKDRTTFVIAHRLSTVRKANKILVFDKGKIVESGTHKELIEKPGGVYQRLYEYQIGMHE